MQQAQDFLNDQDGQNEIFSLCEGNSQWLHDIQKLKG